MRYVNLAVSYLNFPLIYFKQNIGSCLELLHAAQPGLDDEDGDGDQEDPGPGRHTRQHQHQQSADRSRLETFVEL